MAVAVDELLGLAAEHRRVVHRAVFAAQHVRVAKDARLRTVADRGRLARLALEDRWEAASEQLSDEWLRRADIGACIRASRWGEPPPEPPDGIVAGDEPLLVLKRLTGPRTSDMDAVEKWPGMRGIYGMNALMQEGKPGFEVRVLRSPAGDPLAVMAYVRDEGMMHVNLLASAPGGGHGTAAMREIASVAAREGLDVGLVASSQESAGFYRSLGMQSFEIDTSSGWRASETGSRFRWTNKQATLFSQTGGYTAPNAAEAQAALMEAINAASWAVDGAQVYLGMAQATSVTAGQWSLDAMGLNKTFAWAHPRAMARDLFAVRGSKVIQQMHGEHLSRLQQIIARATDPRNPLTLAQVHKKVAEEWPKLKKWQALRIARTETAAVWSTTAANAYMANGVTQVESLVAHGPSIDVDVNGACDYCVEMAAAGALDILGDLPPWHPNCRCDIIPVLQDPETGEQWLPPDEPWAGGDELPACGTPAAAAALAKRRALERWGSVRVIKAKTNCAVPAPDPGEAFGGNTYKKVDGANATGIAYVAEDIAAWPDAAGPAKAHALELSNAEADAFMVSSATGTGKANGIAALLELGAETHVIGVATQAGGASKIMWSIAKEADAAGKDIVVSAEDISDQLLTNLKGKGFVEFPFEGATGMPVQGMYKLEHAKIKAAFKIGDPEPPTPLPEPPKAQAPQAGNLSPGIYGAEDWSVSDLVSEWDNPLHGPAVKHSIEEELRRRGLTVDRARADLARPVSKPGTPLADEHVFSPGGWKKADGTKFMNDHLKGEAYGSRLKSETMQRIASELRRDPKWSADTVSREYGYSASAYGAQGDEAVISQLINNWARTSSDADKRALAIQQAAKEEFGLDVEVFPAHFAGGRESAAAQALIKETMDLLAAPGVRDSLRAFLRAQYNVTQKAFADAGVSHITLYRGIRAQTNEGWMGRPGFGEVTVTDNPLASWSTRFSTSKAFAGHYGHGSRSIMLRAEVPRELVMGFPGYGFGCSNEYEVVLLNHGRNTAWAMVSGERPLGPDEIAEFEARLAAARVEAEVAYKAQTDTHTDWLTAGKPWTGPIHAAKEKAYAAHVSARDAVTKLEASLRSKKEYVTVDKESNFTARIKALAPDRAPPKGGKSKPSAGTQEDIRLLGKRIASLKHKMKYPEKYKSPQGWTDSQMADMQKKLADLEEERRILKEGGGTASQSLADDAGPHVLWQEGPKEKTDAGEDFVPEKVLVDGKEFGNVWVDEFGNWYATYKHPTAGKVTEPDLASKAEAKEFIEIQIENLSMADEIDVKVALEVKAVSVGEPKETYQLFKPDGVIGGAVQKWSSSGQKWMVTLDNGEQYLVSAPKNQAFGFAAKQMDVDIPGQSLDWLEQVDPDYFDGMVTKADAAGNYLSPVEGGYSAVAQDLAVATPKWGNNENLGAAIKIVTSPEDGELVVYQSLGDTIGVARVKKEGDTWVYDAAAASPADLENLKAAIAARYGKVEEVVKVSADELKQQIHLAGKRIASARHAKKALQPWDAKYLELQVKIEKEEALREELRAKLKQVVKKSAYLAKLAKVRRMARLVD